MLELRVAIRLLLAFFCFPIPLQAVVQAMQLGGDRLPTRLDVLDLQRVGELPGAFTGPAQWRIGVAARKRLNKAFQLLGEIGAMMCKRLPSSAGTSDPMEAKPIFLFQFPPSGMDGRSGHAGGGGDKRYAALTEFPRLGGGPDPSGALVKMRPNGGVLAHELL